MATLDFKHDMQMAGYTCWQGKKESGWHGVKLLMTPDKKTLIVENNSPTHAGWILSTAANLTEYLEPWHLGLGDSEFNVWFNIPNEVPGYDYAAILKGYLAAALWLGTNENSEPLDKNYSVDDFLESAVQNSKTDILWFMYHAYPWLHIRRDKFEDDERIGHEFYLTRCGHGSGFWDMDLGHPGEVLSNICRDYFGNADVLETDNKELDIFRF